MGEGRSLAGEGGIFRMRPGGGGASQQKILPSSSPGLPVTFSQRWENLAQDWLLAAGLPGF